LRTIVLDSGAFLAMERRDRSFAAFLEAARRVSATIVIPATVIAEIWRSPPRHQSATMLRPPRAIAPLEGSSARAVGVLLGKAAATQITDAHVCSVAIDVRPSIIVTSDPEDISALLEAADVSYSTGERRKVDVIIRTL